ncbi:uncharacterized protein LOC134477856 [Cavia porcellus]|uniref:uncharacterized protein LOC134477856 n=1 Tax=Cavia porcellus TaxID=10141 RepID=UPI002FE1284F
MRVQPLGFQGRGASAGGAGRREGVLAEAGKGRRGLKAAFFFFFFLIVWLWGGLGPPRKWQAAGSRSVSLSPRPVLRLWLRASSCRSPRPARRGFRRGAAAATAAIAAASLAMWLHFGSAPARRPPPPRAPPAPPPPLPPPPPSSLPRARSPCSAGGSARLPAPPAGSGCTNSPGAAGPVPRPAAGSPGSRGFGRPGPRAPAACAAAGLQLPGSEAAALAFSRLARSLGGSYTCVTDRAKSQLLPGSAADVSDPQPLGGRIVQAE